MLKNGRVLYAGGAVRGRTSSSCELYDPVTDTWAVVASMKSRRQGHASVLLLDGRILVAGGMNSLSERLNLCEVYDPIKNTWDDFPPMSTSHYEHEIMLLENNRVVVMGGSPSPELKIGEYYDWETSTWIKTGKSILPVERNTAVNLGNGYILIIAGRQWELINTSLLYSQNILFFRNLRKGFTGLELLPDGSVIAMGEYGIFDDVLRTTSACERYFPAPTKIEMIVTESIESFKLYQNYPNPFNPSTTIRFELPRQEVVSLHIIDLLGRRVRTLVEGELGAGEHAVVWDGRDQSGIEAAAGIYFARLRAGDETHTIKLLLVR